MRTLLTTPQLRSFLWRPNYVVDDDIKRLFSGLLKFDLLIISKSFLRLNLCHIIWYHSFIRNTSVTVHTYFSSHASVVYAVFEKKSNAFRNKIASLQFQSAYSVGGGHTEVYTNTCQRKTLTCTLNTYPFKVYMFTWVPFT